MGSLKINIQDVEKAHEVLRPVARRTPLGLALGESCSLQGVHFKYENLQVTGSFKIRGAFNKLSSLSLEEKSQGVIAASAGNHAQGVALGCQILGLKSHIIMPKGAPTVKIQGAEKYGSQVTLKGDFFDQAFEWALKQAQEQGYTFIHPYEDKKVIAGQGTLGLEVLSQLPDICSIVVPIGGGGLMGGISFVIKTLKPSCKVYGVVLDHTPGMMEMKTGKSVGQSTLTFTLGDGIAIKKPSPIMFKEYIDPYVDEIVSVGESEMAQAIVYCIEKEKVVLEGSGVAGLAALLSGKLKLPPGPSCIVLCGGNIDLSKIRWLVDESVKNV